MKVCVKPTGLHSRAMVRVAAALAAYAPKGVTIVDDPAQADLQILHGIGFDTLNELRSKDYVVIQYCGFTIRDAPQWQEIWQGARMVWSYYPLQDVMPAGVPFFHAPLGVDPVFGKSFIEVPREIKLMTSGYSNSPSQEAISDAAWACQRVHGQMVHLGPKDIEGMTEYPRCWEAQNGIPDSTLARLYHHTQWVSGLRYVEGFELPALEGAICGARPIVFDRVDMRQWFEGFATFVPECAGEELIDRLTSILLSDGTIDPSERAAIKERFDWEAIAIGFWRGVTWARKPQVQVAGKRRLLWIGDAVTATGFERGTRYVTKALQEKFDVHILGLNYSGDPLPSDYPTSNVWPCRPGGDPMGVGRTARLISDLGPAVVVVQNDPWNFPPYLQEIGSTPTIGYVAVDGLNCSGNNLNGLAKAIFWTKFGEDEARKGGYAGESAIVPLGVDLNIYKPYERADVRERAGLPERFAERGLPADTFIVGVVGRNQWRKRLDLTIQYFAEWIHSRHITDAALWIHAAPTGDDAWPLESLLKYYGVTDRAFWPIMRGQGGISETAMARVYSRFDVLFSTTLGEGMWLPGLEAAACGIPIIAPKWSAVDEIFSEAAHLVPCTSTAVHPHQSNTIGGVMDRVRAIQTLDLLYRDHQVRLAASERSLALAAQPQFRWEQVGAAFLKEVEATLSGAIHEQQLVEA